MTKPVHDEQLRELEKKIREICTYYSEYGEGTAGYSLSEEQFQKLLSRIDSYAQAQVARALEEKKRDILGTARHYHAKYPNANYFDCVRVIMGSFHQTQDKKEGVE
jgi:hypothetical protein